MAPTKKTAQDDSSSSSKAPAISAKAAGKKPASSNLNQVSVTKEKDSAKTNGVNDDNDSDNSKGLSWDKEPITILQRYRFQHRLAQSSPYSDSFHRAVLENRGLGQHSPTAVAKRRAGQKHTSKQHLAMAVRKHFNSMPADQTAVAAGMVYTINNQERDFKKRTAPHSLKLGQT